MRSAIKRVLQGVLSGGFSRSLRRTISASSSGVILLGGRPERDPSSSSDSPSSRYRSSHRCTVGSETPISRARARSDTPPVASRMIPGAPHVQPRDRAGSHPAFEALAVPGSQPDLSRCGHAWKIAILTRHDTLLMRHYTNGLHANGTKAPSTD